jgi:two-component system phosphate regulon response regulator PhoB
MAKILIVEDDLILDEAYRKKFSPVYDLQVAMDGETGVSMTREWRPDLVILDIYMPGKIDGLEYLRLIKSDPAISDIPVLVLTNLPDMAEKTLSLGAFKCLMKTETDLARLELEIAEVLKK